MGFFSKLVGTEKEKVAALDGVNEEAVKEGVGTASDPAPSPAPINRVDVKLFEIDIGYQDNGDSFALLYFKWLDEAGNTQITSARLKSGNSIARLISVLEFTAEHATNGTASE